MENGFHLKALCTAFISGMNTACEFLLTLMLSELTFPPRSHYLAVFNRPPADHHWHQ